MRFVSSRKQTKWSKCASSFSTTLPPLLLLLPQIVCGSDSDESEYRNGHNVCRDFGRPFLCHHNLCLNHLVFEYIKKKTNTSIHFLYILPFKNDAHDDRLSVCFISFRSQYEGSPQIPIIVAKRSTSFVFVCAHVPGKIDVCSFLPGNCGLLGEKHIGTAIQQSSQVRFFVCLFFLFNTQLFFLNTSIIYILSFSSSISLISI